MKGAPCGVIGKSASRIALRARGAPEYMTDTIDDR